MIMKPLSSFFLTSFPLPETIPPNCAHAGLGASPGAPMAHSKACRMHGWHTQGLRVRIRGIPVSGCLGSPPLTVAAFIAVIAAIVAIAVGAAALTA